MFVSLIPGTAEARNPKPNAPAPVPGGVYLKESPETLHWDLVSSLQMGSCP